MRCLAYESAATRKDVQTDKGFRSEGPRSPNVPFSSIPVDHAFDRILPHYNAIEFRKHLLPTFPLWPGLLADTGLFAGAWALLIFTPLGVRRWLRARRGGCPQCGYSREGLKEGAACPECGRGA